MQNNIKWRARFLIDSGSILELGNYNTGNSKLHIQTIPDEVSDIPDKIRSQYRLVDVYVENNNEKIEDVYIKCNEIISMFLAKLSLITYHPTGVMFLSVCKYPVQNGDKFQLLTTNARTERSPVTVSPDEIEELYYDEKDSNYYKALESLHLGQNSKDVAEKFLNYYRALEYIAEKEAQEIVYNTCSHCGEKSDSGRKATGRYIKDILKKFNFSNKESSAIVKIRGQLSHGNTLMSIDFIQEIVGLLVKLEPAVMSIIADRYSVKIKKRGNVIMHLPISVFNLAKDFTGNFIYDDAASTVFYAAFPRLESKYCTNETTVSDTNFVFIPTGKDMKPKFSNLMLPI